MSNENNIEKILIEALKKTNIKEISNNLNVATGTINRWISSKKVPHSYEFELMKICDLKIDYSLYSSKKKDQFFTPYNTSKHCYDVFENVMKNFGEDIDDFFFIEPSAGDGSFLKVLPINKTTSLDIEPRHKDIIKQDYLTWIPETKNKYIVFGNPPFGLRGHLALKFINHSNKFADFVCFILPPLFQSDGKGSPMKRVLGYNLIHSEELLSDFYEPENHNKNVIINTIFQIWSKKHISTKYILETKKNKTVKIFSLSNGGTSSSTRNKKMIDKCHVYLPSTCFGKENVKCYNTFEDLPNKRGYGLIFIDNIDDNKQKAFDTNWSIIAFLSTNSAYNLRSSKIEDVFK